ncbi:transcriptional regulator [Bacillus sp. Y1]|nr:transcriptional regulator [Bacillus sp. Y1]AYA77323.1 transcriptional regulator [Bacillus sp. Y1]
MDWFNLGKKRSKFGKFIDKEGISQTELRKKTKLGHGTVTSLCNDKDYVPKISTWVKVQRALKSMGYDVDRKDYFDM